MIYITGVVIHGLANGHKIGIPTININIDKKVEINYGVYACHVLYDNERYLGLANIGNRPSVDNKELIEVHILDFDKDLYGQEVSIEVNEYLRDIKKFANLDELRLQIQSDIKQVRNLYF